MSTGIVNVKDINFDQEKEHSLEIIEGRVYIDGFSTDTLSIAFCKAYAKKFGIPCKKGRSKKSINAYLIENGGTLSIGLPQSILHGNDAAPISGDVDSAVVHAVRPQSKSLNGHEPSVGSDDTNDYLAGELGDGLFDSDCADDLWGDNGWGDSFKDNDGLGTGGDTDDSMNRKKEEICLSAYVDHLDAPFDGGGEESKHDAAPVSGDEDCAVLHVVRAQSKSLNGHEPNVDRNGAIQFPGCGGQDCLYNNCLISWDNADYDGSGGDNKSPMAGEDFGTGDDTGERTKEENCQSEIAADGPDADFDGDVGIYDHSQQNDNVTTTPSRVPTNSHLVTPVPIFSNTQQGDPEEHYLLSSLFFFQRANQVFSDRLTEADVPFHLQPQFGDLYHWSYRSRSMTDFFESWPPLDSQQIKLIQTEQVGPLRKQDSSNPKREHGYISFKYDNYFVDRIYYMLDEGVKHRGTFWDTAILQKTCDHNRLMTFRLASMHTVTQPNLVDTLNKMTMVELEQCELGILLQVYADRYNIPAIVLEHVGPLLQEKRFGSSYHCRGQSECLIRMMPYIIFLHDREINDAGSLMKTADLFLPAPDDTKKTNRGVVHGHAQCYPVDSSGNYMPYYEYQRSEVENVAVLRRLIDHHCIDFQPTNPLVNIKTMREGYDRFHDESALRVSYLLERAILQAFLPFDGDSGTITSDIHWLRLCVDFLKKVQAAYKQEFESFTTYGPLRDQFLQDPEDEICIRFKLFISSRLIMRRIVLIDLDNGIPTSIICQEPHPSVNVEWPLLYVGRRNNKDKGGQDHPYVYYAGKICRLGLANTGSSSHQDPLPTPKFLQEDVPFADIQDLHTGTGVTCNLDAMSVIATDFEKFGKTFADVTSQHQNVCPSSPCVKLRRFLRPQPSGASRLKIDIYTKPSANKDGQYSFFRDAKSGFVKKRTVSLTKFRTHYWGEITVNSYGFVIGLTILEPVKSKKTRKNFSHLALERGRKCIPWTQVMLDGLAEILNLAEAAYDHSTEGSHSTMNTEYNGKWETIAQPEGAKTYIKLDGVGFYSLCRRVKEICLKIDANATKVKRPTTFLLAKKILKRGVFTAVSPGSKTQNSFANYKAEKGVNGESQLGTTLHNTCISVVSNIIPNVMSGAKFVFDLGYNVAEESYQHSIFVLNENAAKAVQKNLSLNVEIARNCMARNHDGIVNLLQLWEVYRDPNGSEVGSHCTNEFLTCLVGMEVCVFPRGHAHGCIINALQNCSVQVMFYETNSDSNTYHSFRFDDIYFAEFPATDVKKACILFNTKERTTRKVLAHRMTEDVLSQFPIIYIDGEQGEMASIFDPTSNVLCPYWPLTDPKWPLPVGGIHDLVNLIVDPVESGQQQNGDETIPASLETASAAQHNKTTPFLHKTSQSNSISLLENENPSSVTRSPAQCNTAGPIHHKNSESNSKLLLQNEIEQISNHGSLHPFGIVNPNCLCYIIATIQMLISGAPILRAIQGAVNTASSGETGPDSVSQFRALLKQYAHARSLSESPLQLDLGNILQDPLFNPIFVPGLQCCALEACQKLTQSLFGALPDLGKLFQYTTSTEFFCTCCEKPVKVAPESTTTSPFVISLSVKSSDASKSSQSIQGLLTRYFSGGQASASDTVVCRHCTKHENVTGRISLSGEFPTFIVIHLPRNNSQRKDHASVHISPVASFDCKQSKEEYVLRGMVCHVGNLVQEGHYISYGYRKGHSGKNWFKFDDAQVEGFGDCEGFLAQDEECRKTVVMLLYQLRATVLADSKQSKLGKRKDAGDSDPSPCKSERLNSSQGSKTGKTSNEGDTNSRTPKRPRNNKNSPNGLRGGAPSDDCSEGDDASNSSLYSDDDSNDGSAPTDDEIAVGGLLKSNNETALLNEEFLSAEFDDSPGAKAKVPKVNKWPQFGNKRTCGLGTGHFSLQVTMEQSINSDEPGFGIKGPPNGVGSMCVYSSQGKTADADLQRGRAEAHELPFLLHTLFGHAKLNDHELLQFAFRFVESVGKIETCQESMNASLQHAASLRVEYSIMWDPTKNMPSIFIPLLTSEVAKAVPGTELQALFSRRLHLHTYPVSIMKGMLKTHLDSLVTEFKVQARKNLNSAGGIFEKIMGKVRERLSNTTPNITATYIQHSMMLMGLMGGRHGAYAPSGLKDVLAEHLYEIKVTNEACTSQSDLSRLLGFHYVIQDAELFPDHADPESGISYASTAVLKCLSTYAARNRNKTLKNEDYQKLVIATGFGQPLSKIHNLETYMLFQYSIARCWTSFLNKWEGATGSIIARQDTSQSLPLARRLANLLLCQVGAIRNEFLESFGEALRQVLVFIIKAYYSDLQDSISLDGEDERTQFSNLAKTRDVLRLQELVDVVQGRQYDQQQFNNNKMALRNVLVSQGNDHATDEVSSFQGRGHVSNYFKPGANMNVLPKAMFGTTMGDTTTSVTDKWRHRFPAVKLFQSFIELFAAARSYLVEVPNARFLEPSQLNRIFHKTFAEVGFQYIWYHSENRLFKEKIILIDASDATFTVDATLLDILLDVQGATLSSIGSDNFSVFGKSLMVPVPKEMRDTVGSTSNKDDFSTFVGHLGHEQERPIFEDFLISCVSFTLGICTNEACAVSTECKCTIWDKSIDTALSFSLAELRGGSERTRKAFLTRATSRVPQGNINSFNATPNQQEKIEIDEKLMQLTTFYQALTYGITCKVLMAWRALRIYYLHSRVHKLLMDKAEAAMIIVQALSGQPPVGATMGTALSHRYLLPNVGGNNFSTSPMVRPTTRPVNYSPQQNAGGGITRLAFQTPTSVVENKALLPFERLTPGRPD